MKNLFIIAIMILLVSCSKKDNPEPSQETIVNKPLSVTCDNSAWTYEVIITNNTYPDSTLQITYTDESGNNADDYLLGSTWTKSFTMQYAGIPVGVFPMTISVDRSNVTSILGITTDITINIYQNGTISQSVGPQSYCWDDQNICYIGPVVINYQCN